MHSPCHFQAVVGQSGRQDFPKSFQLTSFFVCVCVLPFIFSISVSVDVFPLSSLTAVLSLCYLKCCCATFHWNQLSSRSFSCCTSCHPFSIPSLFLSLFGLNSLLSLVYLVTLFRLFSLCLSENIFDNLCRFVVSLPLVDCLSFLECIFFSPRRRDWPLLLLLFHMLLSAIHVLNFMLLRRFSTLVFLWMSSEEDVACSI